jgi:hypothetical protein
MSTICLIPPDAQPGTVPVTSVSLVTIFWGHLNATSFRALYHGDIRPKLHSTPPYWTHQRSSHILDVYSRGTCLEFRSSYWLFLLIYFMVFPVSLQLNVKIAHSNKPRSSPKFVLLKIHDNLLYNSMFVASAAESASLKTQSSQTYIDLLWAVFQLIYSFFV